MTGRPNFLIVRGQDLVVLGVSWSGFETVEDAALPPEARLRLIASGNARISLTFPPQSIVEEKLGHIPSFFAPPSNPFSIHRIRRKARLSGPSRLEFEVAAGTIMNLTVGGILEVIARSARIVTEEDPETLEEVSFVEMPWGLFVVPGDGSPLISEHSAEPVESQNRRVSGLWHSRIKAGSGSRHFIRPFSAGFEEPDFDISPLSFDNRQRISLNSGLALPTATRLELSALGGSLTASGVWPDMEWDHDTRLGRDQYVKLLTKGELYPFGHPAVFVEVVKREFTTIFPRQLPHPEEGSPTPTEPGPPTIPGWEAVDALSVERTLIITDPIRDDVDDIDLSRRFPFTEVEVLRREFSGLGEPGDNPFFIPRLGSGHPLNIPVRCRGLSGDVFFDVPMVFVRTPNVSSDELANAWAPFSTIRLPGVPINLVRSLIRAEGDVQEVHSLALQVRRAGDGYRPLLTHFDVELPALRSLLPGKEAKATLEFTDDFIAQGDAARAALKPIEDILIDFSNNANRSGGLISPKFAANVISREFGPVMDDMISGAPGVPDLASVYKDFRLLGFPLSSLLKTAPPNPPKIVPIVKDGKPVGAEMTWSDLEFESHGPFKASENPSTSMVLTVRTSPDDTQTTCTVSNFSFLLPPESSLLKLNFGSVEFTQKAGQAPDLKIGNLQVNFEGALKLLEEVQVRIQETLGIGGRLPTIKSIPDGIKAAYELSLPSVPAAAFLLRNVAIGIAIEVPFSGRPVTTSLNLATREDPFNLTVLAFGGGGYVDIQIAGTELSRLEMSMNFGAFLAVDFVVASAEVHAFGGVNLTIGPNGAVALEAFIRIGGSIEILGLVSVAVELLVVLTYDEFGNRLVGRAKLVIEIDLTLYSESVEIDSGEWVLIGGTAPVRDVLPVGGILSNEDNVLRAWRKYREAFAPA